MLDGPESAPTTGAVDQSSTDPNARSTGWLALGQSFSTGWRASCRSGDGGRRDLGSPVLIDGFANGWRVGPDGCAEPEFAFAPQKAANISYAISLLAFLAGCALLLVGWRRGRGRKPSPAPESGDAVEISASAYLPASVEIRAGEDQGNSPGHLQRAATWLMATSAVLVAALGVIYVSNPDPSRQGINFDYAVHQSAAHWVAVFAMLLLLAGGAIRLGGRLRSRR